MVTGHICTVNTGRATWAYRMEGDQSERLGIGEKGDT